MYLSRKSRRSVSYQNRTKVGDGVVGLLNPMRDIYYLRHEAGEDAWPRITPSIRHRPPVRMSAHVTVVGLVDNCDRLDTRYAETAASSSQRFFLQVEEARVLSSLVRAPAVGCARRKLRCPSIWVPLASQ